MTVREKTIKQAKKIEKALKKLDSLETKVISHAFESYFDNINDIQNFRKSLKYLRKSLKCLNKYNYGETGKPNPIILNKDIEEYLSNLSEETESEETESEENHQITLDEFSSLQNDSRQTLLCSLSITRVCSLAVEYNTKSKEYKVLAGAVICISNSKYISEIKDAKVKDIREHINDYAELTDVKDGSLKKYILSQDIILNSEEQVKMLAFGRNLRPTDNKSAIKTHGVTLQNYVKGIK